MMKPKMHAMTMAATAAIRIALYELERKVRSSEVRSTSDPKAHSLTMPTTFPSEVVTEAVTAEPESVGADEALEPCARAIDEPVSSSSQVSSKSTVPEESMIWMPMSLLESETVEFASSNISSVQPPFCSYSEASVSAVLAARRSMFARV